MRQPSRDRIIDLTDGVRSRWSQFSCAGNVIVPAIFIFVLVYLLFKSVVMVGAGERAVIFSRISGVLNTQLGEGIHFIWPAIQEATTYDMKAQTYTMSGTATEGTVRQSDALACLTSDGLTVWVELSIRFHADPEQVWRLHQEIGPDYVARVVRPEARSDTRMVISGYNVTDIYSGRRQFIQEEVSKKLAPKFQKSYLILDEVLFRDVKFPEAFQRAIEQKQVAQQEVQQMVFVLQKARRERERKIIDAEGEAQAIRMKAQALIANPQLIQYEYIQRLPADTQTIITDGSAILNLGDVLFGSTPGGQKPSSGSGAQGFEGGTP